jgi:hypothetical protein
VELIAAAGRSHQFCVLVLRTMIAVGVQNGLRVRQVLLEDERVHCINDHVVAAVHHEHGLSDLLQASMSATAPFPQLTSGLFVIRSESLTYSLPW